MSDYLELDGVAWCEAHGGIVDECADYVDDNGEPCCDQWKHDRRDGLRFGCEIVSLFVRVPS